MTDGRGGPSLCYSPLLCLPYGISERGARKGALLTTNGVRSHNLSGAGKGRLLLKRTPSAGEEPAALFLPGAVSAPAQWPLSGRAGPGAAGYGMAAPAALQRSVVSPAGRHTASLIFLHGSGGCFLPSSPLHSLSCCPAGGSVHGARRELLPAGAG